jgi:RimJ/RimL family protein N-acetyltransferase
MYTHYTGERVLIRPFKDKAEYRYVMEHSTALPNDNWGPWHWPEAIAGTNFDESGLLSADKYSQFAVERLDTGEVVGYEEYGPPEPAGISAWLGTEILRPHWSNGFGIEAKQLVLCYLFENFPLETVYADTCSPHVRAQRGLEACGMRYVGKFNGTHIKDGRYEDVYNYQIFREQWEQLDYRHTVKRG